MTRSNPHRLLGFLNERGDFNLTAFSFSMVSFQVLEGSKRSQLAVVMSNKTSISDTLPHIRCLIIHYTS